MPYTIRKVPKRNCYSVKSAIKRKGRSRRVYAKCTTKAKAKKQVRLLRAIEFNPKFVPRK